jgi:hypothetical protein
MITLLILFVLSGLLLVFLAIPLMSDKIPPNGLYGFRLKATMGHPQIWYPVNRFFSKYLLATGLATVIAALLLYFVPGITLDAYAWSVMGVFLLFFVPGVVISYRYMRRLAAENSPDS